jgi:hypothetical protein
MSVKVSFPPEHGYPGTAGPTPRLRVTQTSLASGRHRVQIDLESSGLPHSATSEYAFTLGEQDREDLRWYLEDCFQCPIEPAPAIAAWVEQRMSALGGELFQQLFASSQVVLRPWARLGSELARTRVEVTSEVDADAVLPWEPLTRPPGSRAAQACLP